MDKGHRGGEMKGSGIFVLAWVAGIAVLSVFLALPVPADSRSGSSFCETTNLRKIEARATGSRTQGVALAMKNDVLGPGEVATARLFNRSKTKAGYGVALRIERLMYGEWSLDPASPKGPWPKKLERLDPGKLSTCFRFTVPADQPAGRYRFTVPVQIDRRAAHRSALFQVLP